MNKLRSTIIDDQQEQCPCGCGHRYLTKKQEIDIQEKIERIDMKPIFKRIYTEMDNKIRNGNILDSFTEDEKHNYAYLRKLSVQEETT